MVFLLEHTAEAVQAGWQGCFAELARRGYVPDPARPAMERYAAELVAAHRSELCVPLR